MPRRHELSERQWSLIKDLIPGKAGDPGRHGDDNRRFVNACVYVLKTAVPWDDLPERFGKSDTIRKRFDRWCAAGVWQKLARALGDPDLDEVQLDSTIVRAHPVAATGRRRAGEKKTTPTPAAAWAAPAVDSALSCTPRPTHAADCCD
jgi:putative transposase